MDPAATLRRCPFCANPAPIIGAVGRDAVERIAVICPECGVGPMATADDPQGRTERLGNQRFGADH